MTKQDVATVSGLLAAAVEHTPPRKLGRLSRVEDRWLPVLLPLVLVFAGLLGWSGLLAPPEPSTPAVFGVAPVFLPVDGLPGTVVPGQQYELSVTVIFPRGWPGPGWPNESATFDLDGYSPDPGSRVDVHYCMKVLPDVVGRLVTVTCPITVPAVTEKFTIRVGVYTPTVGNDERSWFRHYVHQVRPAS